jgi:hypothetical protein
MDKIPGVIRSLLSRRSLAATVLTAVATLVAPHIATAQVPSSPSVVKIRHCSISKPRPFSHLATGTAIAYTNTGPTILHGITFAVGYRTSDGNLTRTFEDAGIFAPNEPVSHHFAAYSDVQYAGPRPTSCSVVAVR